MGVLLCGVLVVYVVLVVWYRCIVCVVILVLGNGCGLFVYDIE